MSLKINTNRLLNEEEKKKDAFFKALSIISTNEARAQSRVDTGLSRSSKFSTVELDDIIVTQAPVEYDIYLEYRYGIMTKALVETAKKIPTLIRKVFK